MTNGIEIRRFQPNPGANSPALRLPIQATSKQKEFLRGLLPPKNIFGISPDTVHQKVLEQKDRFTRIASIQEAKDFLTIIEDINNAALNEENSERKIEAFIQAYETASGETIPKDISNAVFYVSCRAFMEIFHGISTLYDVPSKKELRDISLLFYKTAMNCLYVTQIFEHKEIIMDTADNQVITLKHIALREAFKIQNSLNPLDQNTCFQQMNELFELFFLLRLANAKETKIEEDVDQSYAGLHHLLFNLFNDQKLNSLNAIVKIVYQDLAKKPLYIALRQLQIIEGLEADGKNEKEIKNNLQPLKNGIDVTDVAIEFPRAVSILAQEENLSPAQKDLIYNATLAIIKCKNIELFGLILAALDLQGETAIALKTRALQLMFLDCEGIFRLGTPALLDFLCASQYVPSREDVQALEAAFPGLISPKKGTLQYARQHANQSNTGVKRLLDLKQSNQEESNLQIPQNIEELDAFVEETRKKEREQLQNFSAQFNQNIFSNPHSIDLAKTLEDLQNISYQLLSYNPAWIEAIVGEYSKAFDRAFPHEQARAAGQITEAAVFVWGKFDRAPESIKNQYEGLRQRSEIKLATLEKHHLQAMAAAAPEEIERIIREDLAENLKVNLAISLYKIAIQKISSAPFETLEIFINIYTLLEKKTEHLGANFPKNLQEVIGIFDDKIRTKTDKRDISLLTINLTKAQTPFHICQAFISFFESREKRKDILSIKILEELVNLLLPIISPLDSNNPNDINAANQYAAIYEKIYRKTAAISIAPEQADLQENKQNVMDNLSRINAKLQELIGSSRETGRAYSQEGINAAADSLLHTPPPPAPAPALVEPANFLPPKEKPFTSPQTPSAKQEKQVARVKGQEKTPPPAPTPAPPAASLRLPSTSIEEIKIRIQALQANDLINSPMATLSGHLRAIEAESNLPHDLIFSAAAFWMKRIDFLTQLETLPQTNEVKNCRIALEYLQKILKTHRGVSKNLPSVEQKLEELERKQAEEASKPAPQPLAPPPLPPTTTNDLINDNPEISLNKALTYLADPQNLTLEKILNLLSALYSQIEAVRNIAANPKLTAYVIDTQLYVELTIKNILYSYDKEEKIPSQIKSEIKTILNISAEINRLLEARGEN